MEEYINYDTDYQAATKIDEIEVYQSTWISIRNIILSETKSQQDTPKI